MGACTSRAEPEDVLPLLVGLPLEKARSRAASNAWCRRIDTPPADMYADTLYVPGRVRLAHADGVVRIVVYDTFRYSFVTYK
jgi:hypothetical protein